MEGMADRGRRGHRQARFFPWLDRSGRLSWLKLVVFAGLFIPGVLVALQWGQGWLAPKPVTEAIHATGEWAVRFLLLSLLVSTLRKVALVNQLIAVRRMLGLAALAYASIHLCLYVVDQHYDLVRVASEIVLRFYLTIGFVALTGLIVLGATSTDGMIRRIGGKRWNGLHRLVYPIVVLALLHFMIQSKLDVTQPVLMTGLLLLLMGQRLLKTWTTSDAILPLAALALVAPVLTALFEAAWYAVRNHIAFGDVMAANFDFDSPLRPAWFVLIAGLILVAVRLARGLWVAERGRPARRPKAAREFNTPARDR